MDTLQKICLVFTIIGALNWGLVGLFDFNLVGQIFGGNDSMFPNVVYTLIALAGIINIGLLITPFHPDDDKRRK